MTDLNIRNIDPNLHASAKAKASLERRNLKDVVIELLKEYAADMPGCADLNAAHCPVAGPLIKGKVGKNEKTSR